MKTIAITMLFLLSLITFQACQTTEAEACIITCQNQGIAQQDAFGDCTCNCPNGYSGDFCEIEDACITQNINCGPNGNCNNGVCACDDGYEGSLCAIESREKFLGTYGAVWLCGNWTADVGLITIHKDLNQVDEVTITYIYADGTSHVIHDGEIKNGTTLEFSDIRFGPDIDFVGSYSINPNTNQEEIIGTFEWGDGSATQSCNGTWFKQ